MVHGHVRISLKFVTFRVTVVNKIVQVVKNNVINNKPPFRKKNSYASLDYVVPEIFTGAHFD